MSSDQQNAQPGEDPDEDGDLTDMLGEMRVLLPGAQLLSAFLVTVPFNAGFATIVLSEKRVFLVTFILALSSLILLSAPAVQHRLIRPLRDRARFKRFATRQIIAGSMALSLALVLATHLVLSQVFSNSVGMLAASLIAVLITLFWWILPRVLRKSGRV
jgi:hypothetical protein